MAKKDKTKAPAGASGKKGTASKAQYSADMQRAIDEQRESFRKTKAQDNWQPAAGRHTFLVLECAKMDAKKKTDKQNGNKAYTAINKRVTLKQLDGEPHTGQNRSFNYFCRSSNKNPEYSGAGEWKALAAIAAGQAVDDITECDSAVDTLVGKALECVVEQRGNFTNFNWEGFAQSADVVDEEPTSEPDDEDEDDDDDAEEPEAADEADDEDDEDEDDDD